ncbi:hypothetical protein SBBP2_230021 [Burkholderiales bacterium]|nr:hypothetical protein SBBP2_230021 [Burkholderiales bacterium]
MAESTSCQPAHSMRALRQRGPQVDSYPPFRRQALAGRDHSRAAARIGPGEYAPNYAGPIKIAGTAYPRARAMGTPADRWILPRRAGTQ